MSQFSAQTLSQIAPELRDGVKQTPRAPINHGLGRWLIRGVIQLLLRYKQYEGIDSQTYKLPSGQTVRVYTPQQKSSDSALLWIHGGGLLIGSPKQDDQFCAEVAQKLGITVLSASYRLAPENPFPHAINDCFSAWKWIQQSAQQLQINPERIAIGGQSAGGGLAASLVQRIHDEKGIQPIAQWLFCPMLDDRTATQQELDAIKHFIWDNRQNRTGWTSYLGAEFGAKHVTQYAVPARRENLAGLPPAWIGVGDIELFFDENRTYAERLKQAGVDCTLDIVKNAPHGFERISVNAPLVQDYLTRSMDWLGNILLNNDDS